MRGVGPLTRFALRRDRVRLPLWALLLVVLVVGVAASWDRIYPDAGDRLQLLAIVSANPALSALLGPLHDPLSTGSLTEWRITSGVLFVLGMVFSTTITRHVRAEEQSGRAEMLMAAPFARLAPLLAAVLVTLITAVVFVAGAVVLLWPLGIPVTGSLLFASALASCALVFAAISAIANQVFRSARAITGAAGGALLVFWIISALGNIQDSWLVWLSPFGWAQRVDAYGAGHWWVVGLALAVAALGMLVAVRLQARRDLAGGLIPQRPGAASASDRLRGAHSLAWRLESGTVIGWVVGFAFAALFVGFSRDALIGFANSSPQLARIIEALGGTGPILEVFVAFYIGAAGVATGFLAVAMVLRLRAEEDAGHAEVVLATRTGRTAWASAYYVLALIGSLLVLMVLGVILGLLFGLPAGEGLGQVGPVTGAAVSWLAPALFMAGLTLALVGLLPKYATAAWIVMTAFAVVTELGTVFGLPSWALNLSPFSHLAKAPAQAVAAAPLVWLTAGGVLLAVAGFIGIRTRDVRSTG